MGLVSIIFVVFAILQIILFFKIWGMTNDVRVIKESLLARTREESPNREKVVSSSFSIGALVVDNAKGKQMRVKEIKDGKYACYSNGGITFEGLFDESEIKLFQPKS